MTPFDSTTLAPNGLRRGVTTGTCATAAVKAALTRLLHGEICDEVRITLPDQVHFISIPIKRVVDLAESVRAEVIKDAGDDPDQTHRATLTATVSRNKTGRIQFLPGPGVGLVTERGLQIPVGEPAINPVPREMMRQAVEEVLSETEIEEEGFDLEIGCERGEEIAKRTFNPRLGIVGGISILGTTGIVEPKSMAAFKAAIEIYIDVALADNPDAIVLTPGNLGQRFARTSLGLPMKRVVQMSNFVGFSLAHMEKSLAQTRGRLPRLWLAGHPGKLAKLMEDIWDTHSSEGGNGVRAVTRFAEEVGLELPVRAKMGKCTTVEGIIEVLESHAGAESFWSGVSERIAQLVAARLTRVDDVCVRLFKMDGTPLGGKS
jgi:cobalt-precorrin-5B (C1)-methyltransferase